MIGKKIKNSFVEKVFSANEKEFDITLENIETKEEVKIEKVSYEDIKNYDNNLTLMGTIERMIEGYNIERVYRESDFENVYVLLGKPVDGDSDNVYIELKLSS